MAKIDIDDLERKARNATPGPWTTTKPPKEDGWQLGVVIGGTMAGKVYAQPPGGQMPLADLEHIAAASPPVVLALIAEIKRLGHEALNAAVLLEARSDAAARREWAAAIRERVAQGVVLP